RGDNLARHSDESGFSRESDRGSSRMANAPQQSQGPQLSTRKPRLRGDQESHGQGRHVENRWGAAGYLCESGLATGRAARCSTIQAGQGANRVVKGREVVGRYTGEGCWIPRSAHFT